MRRAARQCLVCASLSLTHAPYTPTCEGGTAARLGTTPPSGSTSHCVGRRRWRRGGVRLRDLQDKRERQGWGGRGMNGAGHASKVQHMLQQQTAYTIPHTDVMHTHLDALLLSLLRERERCLLLLWPLSSSLRLSLSRSLSLDLSLSRLSLQTSNKRVWVRELHAERADGAVFAAVDTAHPLSRSRSRSLYSRSL